MNCEEGLITAIYLPSDQGNISKIFVEADVLLLSLWHIIKNIRVATGFTGLNNGIFILPKPATDWMALLEMTDSIEAYDRAMQSDGDFVIVDYVNGNRPVIRDVILRSTQIAPRYYMESNKDNFKLYINGSYLEIDNTGNINILHANNKEINIKNSGGTSEVVIKSDGSVEIATGATEYAAKYESLKNEYDNHIHPAGLLLDSLAAPCTGTTGAPAIALTNAVKATKLKIT